MQILNPAIQNVDRMDHPQLANVAYLQLNRAASKIFGIQPDHAREEINLFHPAALRALGHLTRLWCRVIESGYPRLPAQTGAESFSQQGIADEIGICRYPGDEICGTLDLQMIGPEGEGLPPDEQTARRANAQDLPHVLGSKWCLGIRFTPHRN